MFFGACIYLGDANACPQMFSSLCISCSDDCLSLSSMQTPPAPDPARQEKQKEVPAEDVGTGEGTGTEEPDLSTLSLGEKMAMFNRLSHPPAPKPEGTCANTRSRRRNGRFQTQPITQGEVNQVN